MISIIFNGAEVAAAADTLAQLLDQQQIDTTRGFLAIALNGEVVPRRDWAATSLRDGDRIEIVQPMKGG